jgi:hypothetical protein
VIAGFAALHLVSGHMIEQSHASPSIEPSAFAAVDEAKCSPEAPHLSRCLTTRPLGGRS